MLRAAAKFRIGPGAAGGKTRRLINEERLHAIRELDRQARELERSATGPDFAAHVERERAISPSFDGKRV